MPGQQEHEVVREIAREDGELRRSYWVRKRLVEEARGAGVTVAAEASVTAGRAPVTGRGGVDVVGASDTVAEATTPKGEELLRVLTGPP